MANPKEKCLEDLKNSLIELDSDKAKTAAVEAMREGYSVETVIKEGLGKALLTMGKKYEEGEIFLPELTIAGDIGTEIMEILKKHMKVEETISYRKKVVLATTKGDIHDLGKKIISAMLIAAGYGVIDLGVDVSESRIIDEAEKVGADFIGLSSAMTTTMMAQRDVIKLLEEIGLRTKYKVAVGGGSVTWEWARQIGADGYAENAFGVVRLLEELKE